MCKPALTNAILTVLSLTISFFNLAGMPRAEAQTYEVLYSFSGPDGAFPSNNLTMDAAGNLYGTAGGGTGIGCYELGCGTVFKIDTAGKETVLHSFDKTDGSNPSSSITLDAAGNLYGATLFGGTSNPPAGVVYKIDTQGKYAMLHDFPKSRPHDGYTPASATLIRDKAGNLYGSTELGGTGNCGAGDGCGTVFKVDPKHRETVTPLSNLNSPPGFAPGAGSIIRDAKGNIYGATAFGGDVGCHGGGGVGCGTVFKVDTHGKVHLLYSFKGAPDGSLPVGALTFDHAGNIYGATFSGGDDVACPVDGCGVIFKITPAGKETIVHTFHGSDGAISYGLVFDPKGNLYGTTNGGGAFNLAGTIFKIDVKGQFHVLYNFTGKADGGSPTGGLIRDKAGNLYGTSFYGGNLQCYNGTGCGTVFKFTP